MNFLLGYNPHKNQHMWCDQAKWILCRALSNFRFVVHLVKQSISFVLLKTSPKSDSRFQRYALFCPAENNKIQRDFHSMIGCISKSIFPTYDSFRLITTHILIMGHRLWLTLKLRVKKSTCHVRFASFIVFLFPFLVLSLLC